MQLLLRLQNSEATQELGALLAESIMHSGGGVALFLKGTLGAGKTTLVRGLVSALPGGDNAEVSSPSFNICNIYPTQPETAHYDLYRLEGAPVDDSLYDHIEDGASLTIVEWAEYLPEDARPDHALTLAWQPCDSGRLVTIQATGDKAETILAELASRTAGCTVSPHAG
ncbi:tRNA (adenosine(37)-N6)-threonylcarbamoyltransferase complex ATPase subunit type 1 TsaE [Oleidesulfovibrio sp.]|uniref:tRNA (adenosine(37)-N6)-threonylcarbamoyltransferase complex ATPase subunit type 1 TsaE n=1 Tax=Oleidesulfovibrio sp. TaxID=2909707 RepID=UPI003A8A6C36